MPYGAAVLFVAAATATVFISSRILSAPYLVPLMMGVGVSSLLGLGPGCLAAVLATLASDYFFIPPVMQLNFDHFTLFAAANYALAILIARTGAAVVRRTIARSVLFESFVLGGDDRTLVGRLDGAVDGEIFGWAIDKDQPLVPPKVNIYVDSRPLGEVLPIWYRPDVGQHAFYFDLASVCPENTYVRVEARFSTPQPLANSPVAVRIPPRSKNRALRTVLFMHVAKTAGTAFREAIVQNYKQSEIAYIYPDPPGFLLPRLEDLPLAQRARTRFAVGHFQYGLHALFPQESTYVTIVRDPVRRVISHFRYLLPGLRPPPGVNLASLLIEMLERRHTVNLDNLMVRCFSGVWDGRFPPGHVTREVYELAVHNLRTYFSFVGFQEYAKEAYATLRKQFGWNASASLEAINRGEGADLEAFESARPAIEHFNRWDCELYQEIRRVFPLHVS